MTVEPPTPSNAHGPYTISNATIERRTRIILIAMFAGIALGFVCAFLAAGIDDMSWLFGPLAFIFVLGSPLGAIGVSAFMGAEAIHKHAGWVGIVLIVGICVGIGGQLLWGAFALWVGIGITAVAVVLFWVIGAKAGVPMWLQLPILHSPRVWVTRGRHVEPTDEIQH